MQRFCSIFSHLLQLFARLEFEQVVRVHQRLLARPPACPHPPRQPRPRPGPTRDRFGPRILDRFPNILPTLTIRERHRVKICLSGDLLLPAHDRYRMPSDL